jgi:hypothetical protein
MRGNTYTLPNTEKFACAFDRKVVLPQMDSVSVHRNRNIGMIINDKQRSGLSRCSAQPKRCLVDIFPRSIFVAVLKKTDASRQCLRHGLLRVNAKQVMVEDQADAFEITLAVNCSAP